MPIRPAAISKQAEIAEAVAEVVRILAPDVVYVRYEIGENWYGDPAVFFRSLLSDEAAEKRLRETARKVEQELEERLDFAALGLFSYYNVRSVSEQAALRGKEWA